MARDGVYLVSRQTFNFTLLEGRDNTMIWADIDDRWIRVSKIESKQKFIWTQGQSDGLVKSDSYAPNVEAGFLFRALDLPVDFGRARVLTLRCKSLLKVAENIRVCMPSLAVGSDSVASFVGDRSSPSI